MNDQSFAWKLAHPEKFRSACSRSIDSCPVALRARGFIPSRLKSFVSAAVFVVGIVGGRIVWNHPCPPFAPTIYVYLLALILLYCRLCCCYCIMRLLYFCISQCGCTAAVCYPTTTADRRGIVTRVSIPAALYQYHMVSHWRVGHITGR